MYFKILAEDLTHHKYTYHEGLNVDPKPLNARPVYGGGLFFTDEKNILVFGHYGNKIAEVTVPDGEAIISVENEYKAHRIVLGQIRELWDIETFKWLISCGADVHADNDYALCLASKYGKVEVARLLIEAGANIHVDDDWALRLASRNGHLEIVRYLVEQGANIHADNNYALRWAAKNGHIDVVKHLVEHGADIYARNNLALHWAAESGHEEVVEYLKKSH